MREVRVSPAGDGVRWLAGSGTVCIDLTRDRSRFHRKCNVRLSDRRCMCFFFACMGPRGDFCKTTGYRVYHAPTASTPGKNPSRKLRSSRLTSSTEVALAIAWRTRSASSLDIYLPALGVGRGSSVVMVVVVVDDTVAESWVANVFGKLSDVRNNPLAC